jgi:hypothetical protein
MSDDRSALQRVLDVVVFAPAGLAVTMGEDFPKLVDKGRHRVEGQVHTARLVGQFAVQYGRRQVGEWTSRSDVGAVVPPAADEPAAGEPDDAGGVGAADAPGGDGVARVVAGAAGTGANGRVQATRLAIPGYDSLSASQVVQRLDGLSDAELTEVRTHELASRRRRTILSRVDQLLSGVPPGPA